MEDPHLNFHEPRDNLTYRYSIGKILPIITAGPTVTDVTATSATVGWLTDEASNSEVEYQVVV